MRVIGLMSGTSYDAIDAAAADLVRDGDRLVLTPLGLISRGYNEKLRSRLAAALPPAVTTLADVCRLDTEIGRAFAAAAVEADRELCDGRAELVASHGQTVYHWVADGQVHGTLQIGQPAYIAEATGLPVVADFRPGHRGGRPGRAPGQPGGPDVAARQARRPRRAEPGRHRQHHRPRRHGLRHGPRQRPARRGGPRSHRGAPRLRPGR
ncbi:Anhydro-N-acetylmuramic acid kinase [Streptomyces alboniger]